MLDSRQSSARRLRHLTFALAAGLTGVAPVLLAAEVVQPINSVTISGVRDPQWMSYRDAYRALQQFVKYDQAKDLVRTSFVVSAYIPASVSTPLKVSLVSASLNEDLPVSEDSMVQLPVNRQAYDEDAQIRSNRKAGTHRFQFVASIALRTDGTYTDSYLQSACRQQFDFVRQVNITARLQTIGKRCQGVIFLFPAAGTAGDAAGSAPVQINGGVAETASKDARYRSYEYRFGALPDGQAIHTNTAPIFIKGLYE